MAISALVESVSVYPPRLPPEVRIPGLQLGVSA